jgi:hypothetical protein
VNLSNGIKITKVKAASATGTTAVNSDVIDMAGYEGVLFFVAVASKAVGNFIKAQQGTDGTVSDAVDLEGSKVEPTVDGQVAWLDIYKPQERYLRVVATRGTTTVLGEIYALQYESRVQPTDNVIANLILGSLLVSPAEGTA